MIGDFNLSTKIEFHSTISRHGIVQASLALLIWLNEIVLHTSFIHATMLLPSGALDLHTAKVSHARLAASVFMQHLWKSSSQSKLFERISPTPARNLPIADCRA